MNPEKTIPGGRRVLIFALWVLLILTLVLAGLAFRGQHDRDLDSQWILHAIKTRDQIQRLYSLIKDVETSERGYLLTGNTNFLVPYERARQEIPASSQNLAGLIADNPRQVAAVARLQSLIAKKLSLVAQVLELARQGKNDEAVRLVTEGHGWQFMEEMQSQVNALDAEEDQLLAEREKKFAAQIKSQKTLMRVLVSADVALILVAILLIQMANRLHHKANTRTDEANTREQQSLFASELSYRRLFEAAQDGILILDVDTGRISDVNPYLFNLLGFSRAEMIGQTVGELGPFKDIEKNQMMLERLQKDGYIRYENLPLETKDGRRIAVEFVSNVYAAGYGNVIQCNIRDITESKKAEVISLRLAAIVEFSDDAIIGKDPRGIITNWNKGAEALFGYTASEMVGNSIMRLIPAGRQDEERQILEKIKSGRSVEHFETLRQTKDGRLIDVSVTVSPIRDASGNITGASKVARDITESKRSEDLLKDSFKEISDLKFALDQHAIVSITDPQGIITYANEKFCAVSKYPRAELLGQTHALLNSGHHSKAFIRDLWLTIEHGRVWHGEFKNKAKDASYYWVSMTIVPFLNDAGKPRQYISIRTEVTAHKAAEEKIRQLNAGLEQRVMERTAQLQAANEELEAFSYSVSHDLRAPLRHIAGFMELLKTEAGPTLSEKSRQHLATIAQATRRMGGLIDDLLAFSRVSRAEMQKTDVALDELVRETLNDFSAETAARNIQWEIHPLPQVRADPALLRLVLVNLISNAVKFTGKCPAAKIEIGCLTEKQKAEIKQTEILPAESGVPPLPAPFPTAALPGDETVIFIRDNGAGFDARYADKLFGVFQRLHSQDEFEGTGIGLANVQRIIRRHGGRVWAEGAVDAGATFYFSLPESNGGFHAN